MSTNWQYKAQKYNIKCNNMIMLLGGADTDESDPRKRLKTTHDSDGPPDDSSGPAGAGTGAGADESGAATGSSADDTSGPVDTGSDTIWSKFCGKFEHIPETMPKKMRTPRYIVGGMTDRDEAFSQHTGECWHDSILQFMCFSDKTRDTVISALILNETKVIIDTISAHRQKYLPFVFTDDIKTIFTGLLRSYINNVQKRLCNFISDKLSYTVVDGHVGCAKTTLTDDMIGKELSDKDEISVMGEIGIKRQISAETGITTASSALGFNNLNSDSDHIFSERGGTIYDAYSILCILCYVLLPNDEMIVFESFENLKLGNITEDEIDGLYLTSNNHAICTYDFGSKGVIYDDNNAKMFDFDWRLFIKAYLYLLNNPTITECKIQYAYDDIPVSTIQNKLFFKITRNTPDGINTGYYCVGNKTIPVTDFVYVDIQNAEKVFEFNIGGMMIHIPNTKTYSRRDMAITNLTRNKMYVDFKNGYFNHISRYLDFITPQDILDFLIILTLKKDIIDKPQFKIMVHNLLKMVYMSIKKISASAAESDFLVYKTTYLNYLNYAGGDPDIMAYEHKMRYIINDFDILDI